MGFRDSVAATSYLLACRHARVRPFAGLMRANLMNSVVWLDICGAARAGNSAHLQPEHLEVETRLSLTSSFLKR